MSRKYKFAEKNGAYFVSFATVYWIDVFTRVDYFDTIIESLEYCRKNKGMEIYGYCIMPSHIHLIFRSSFGDPSGLMRDFKGFTSRKMLKVIAENPQESRKEWSLKVFEQKLNYIHHNPVETGFVTDPIDWKYSSARNYGNNDQTVLEIDLN
jgi:putative transposase